ncbi:tyrosine-type recombinase/integrase [Flagellimonas sp. S174]|uniref:tyrosine-type recombinase/integrase n=1 Tax=Flagellimonas sp. S174 TaxID=3410790 RepID=UPI003BF5FFB0
MEGYTQLQKFQKIMELKGYSPNTINSYISCLKLFRQTMAVKYWNSLHDTDIHRICLDFFTFKRMSYSSQKQMLGSLALFYGTMFNRELALADFRPSRKAFKLSVVLAKKEVETILNLTKNLKHKAMLATLYALGLRSGELLNLKIVHLDGERNTIKTTMVYTHVSVSEIKQVVSPLNTIKLNC